MAGLSGTSNSLNILCYSRYMDLSQREKIIITSITGIVLLSAGFVLTSNTENTVDSNNSESVNTDSIKINMKGNSSDLNDVSFDASYLRVDDMYTLDSPELGLESETCLRFYNYTGTVNPEAKTLDGKSEGFATCTLNGTIDLTINEQVDSMIEVSARNYDPSQTLNLEINNLDFYSTTLDREIDRPNSSVRISDYHGRLTLYPPTGFRLIGEGKVVMDGEELSPN